MPKWVDLVRFDAVTGEAEVVVRCILEPDRTIHFEGEQRVIEMLKAGISVSPSRTVMPDEGEEFLRALGREFRNAYFFATDIQDQAEIQPYRLPPLRDAGDDPGPR